MQQESEFNFEQGLKDKHGNVVLDSNGEPIKEPVSNSAVYAWYIWQKGYQGKTFVE